MSYRMTFTSIIFTVLAIPANVHSDDGGRDAEPNLCPHAALLDKLVPELMDKNHVPGVSIVGIENRRIAWHRQYGLRRAGSPEKVDRDTVFEACSMSKTPLAYLAMKLVEQGKLDLDRPLVEYLEEPYLADEPLHKKITARMALSHTTGFPNWRTAASISDKVHWGLGWAIDKTTSGDRIYHSGSNGTGFRCYSQFDPATGTGLVIMTNSTSGRELWEPVVATIAQ